MRSKNSLTKNTANFPKKIEVRNVLVDLDGTLLGAYNVFVSIRFIRKAFWMLRRFGGWRLALRSVVGLLTAFNTPIPGTPQLRLLNADRANSALASRLKLSIEESENILKDLLGKIFPSLRPFFFPMPGAKEFLDWASTKYPLVLATNPVWPQEIIEMRVKWAGIEPTLFRSVTHAYRMHACKPELAYYTEVLEQEKFQASETLLIGNDYKNDLPAVKAGISVFIVSKKKGLRPILVPEGAAPAWTGSFNDLKELLS